MPVKEVQTTESNKSKHFQINMVMNEVKTNILLNVQSKKRKKMN